MIIIHFDFSDGTELSYLDCLNVVTKIGHNTNTVVTTDSIAFFDYRNVDIRDNVLVLKKDGSYVNRDKVFKKMNKSILRRSNPKLLLGGFFKFSGNYFEEMEVQRCLSELKSKINRSKEGLAFLLAYTWAIKLDLKTHNSFLNLENQCIEYMRNNETLEGFEPKTDLLYAN